MFDDLVIPEFCATLVVAETNYVNEILDRARQANLSSEDLEESLKWFHGGDDSQYAHILEQYGAE